MSLFDTNDKQTTSGDGGQATNELAPPGGEAPSTTQFLTSGSIPAVGGDEQGGAARSASDIAFGGPGTAVKGGEGQEIGDPKKKLPETELPPRPPKFAKMPESVVQVLWRSRDTLSEFKGKKETTPFWDMVAEIDASHMQVLVQIMVATKNVGLAKYVEHIESIYNNGSSWGIHFTGEMDPREVTGVAGTHPSWGYDIPQSEVRKAHGAGDHHEWYRNHTGPGNPGLHFGYGADKKHDVHWDPTNPMDRVSDGKPFMMQVPMVPIPMPMYIPEGTAIYNVNALLEHEQDIGKLPGGSGDHSKRGSEPWYSLSVLNSFCTGTDDLAISEENCLKRGEVHNKPAVPDVAARLRSSAVNVRALELQARDLAMQDNSANQAAVAALRTQVEGRAQEMFRAFCDYFLHMYADSKSTPSGADPRQMATWSVTHGLIDWAHDKRKECEHARIQHNLESRGSGKN